MGLVAKRKQRDSETIIDSDKVVIKPPEKSLSANLTVEERIQRDRDKTEFKKKVDDVNLDKKANHHLLRGSILFVIGVLLILYVLHFL